MHERGYVKKNEQSKVRSRIEEEQEQIMMKNNGAGYKKIDVNGTGGVIIMWE